MTDKKKIHQILSSLWKNDDSAGKIYYNQALQDVQTAIDLQEEPVSKDLEEVAELYTLDDSIKPWRSLTKEAFIAGAKWKKQQTISKACKWIEERAARYVVDRFVGSTRVVGIDASITEDFRKDMED